MIEETVQTIRFPRAMLAITIQELQVDGSNVWTFAVYCVLPTFARNSPFFPKNFCICLWLDFLSFQLAAALNASCLALLDSGVCMNGTFCGVNICDIDGKLILDPSLHYCEKATAQFTFAVKCSNFLWKVSDHFFLITLLQLNIFIISEHFSTFTKLWVKMWNLLNERDNYKV